MIQKIKSVRDVRLDIAQAYHYTQDDTFRTPVEALIKIYAPAVERIKKINTGNGKCTLKLVKFRGKDCINKTIVVSEIVKRKLNSQLTKIKELSELNDGFVVKQLSKLLQVHRGAAHKYINILLASNMLTSDGKLRAARYTWNHNSPKSCL